VDYVEMNGIGEENPSEFFRKKEENKVQPPEISV
jgi:hypothetical protein